ncbi:hypothetical protein GCM10027275_13360 [Rhabdobacter roseus]
MLPLHWVAFGLLEVIGFFYFANLLSKHWATLLSPVFTQKLVRMALLLRGSYVLFSYMFYTQMTGEPFEFEAADAKGYHEEAIWLLSLLKADQLPVYLAYSKGNYSDMGYVAYLTVLYSVFGDGILLVRLIKAVLSAYTCLLIYRLASRNFGESTGKIAGILALLSPNLIYYCGLHLKETEMVFLTIFFLERADLLIRSRQIPIPLLAAVLLLSLSLFFFRTVLGAVAMASLLLGLLLYSGRGKIGLGKKVGFGVVMVGLGLLLQGGRINAEIDRYWGDRDTNQQLSMQARANSKSGNSLATYGNAAVFGPLILLAPFPTLVNIDTQQNQMLLNGGYYTRNIFAFFVLLSLVIFWKRDIIREHLLLLSFLFGYLAVLATSKFALAERFHLPILPVLLIFAAFGITQLDKKNVQYFTPYLVLISVLILAWNFFKVAGRGGL